MLFRQPSMLGVVHAYNIHLVMVFLGPSSVGPFWCTLQYKTDIHKEARTVWSWYTCWQGSVVWYWTLLFISLSYVPFCHSVRELDGSWKEVHSLELPEGLRFHTCIISVSIYLWTLLGYFQHIVTSYLQHIVTPYLQHIVTSYLQHIVTPYLQHIVTPYLQHIVTSWTRGRGM